MRELRVALEPLAVPPSASGIAVVIPTYNEAAAIGDVVAAIPRDIVGRIIVADGG